MAEEDAKMIEKYKKGIKETDRVSEKKYEERLAVCKECDLLNAGTCGACGCPHKFWQGTFSWGSDDKQDLYMFLGGTLAL